jgi:hypothetical protein
VAIARGPFLAWQIGRLVVRQAAQKFMFVEHECQKTGVSAQPTSAPVGPKFLLPAAGLDSRQGRNFLRGFGARQSDLGLRRELFLSERFKLQFRSEFSIYLTGKDRQAGEEIKSVAARMEFAWLAIGRR